MVNTVKSPDRTRPSGNSVVLHGIGWLTYQVLVHELENQPGQRLVFDHSTLEIVNPLPFHEKQKKILARFVELITETLDIEVVSLGSTTWSRQDLLKGVEPDECYYIQNESLMRGKQEIDLTRDPPPDLVIEIDITSPSDRRLLIYAALGVPEVWQFDGVKISILKLNQGEYESVDRSIAIAALVRRDIQNWINKAGMMSETRWAKAVRAWGRQLGTNVDTVEQGD